LRFVPTPAVSIAARMFRQEGNPDWLSLSSLCYCIATTTIDLAARVKRYEQLQDLHQRLMTRATDFNVLGQVVSEDLGCSWPLLQDPAPPATLTQAQEDYVRLRRTYGGANRFRQRAISRATEAALAAEAADAKQTLIQLEQTVSRVEGTVLTLAVDQVHLTAPARDDEYYSSERARIAANQVADKVVGGRIGCVDIKTLNGTSSYLPIMLELDCDLVANSVEGGRVEGVRIHRLTDRHPNWEVHCKMVVQKLEGQFEGVIIEDHEPERRPDDPDIGARPLV
jgi:hypothetical protein